MKWARVNLQGATGISRVCGVYEVDDLMRVPDGKYKVKVLQRGPEEFVAYPNICVKSSPGGIPEWTSGLGRTEEEAIEKALASLGAQLAALNGSLQRERFEWSDPVEF
jgi:hypothetical protein